MDTCSSCFFFAPIDKQPSGLCRRFPPVPMLVPGPPAALDPNKTPTLMVQAHFPPMNPNGWCGEHMTPQEAAMGDETGPALGNSQTSLERAIVAVSKPSA